MATAYSDHEIEKLLQEAKPLPEDFRTRLHMRQKRGHKERELDVTGANGTRFRIILRQSDFNALDFSVIVAVLSPSTNQVFRLRRYNGRHQHTNLIEDTSFYEFHIHTATERYQALGSREDAYAELTDRYSDFSGALRAMLEDCGFEMPGKEQMKLL